MPTNSVGNNPDVVFLKMIRYCYSGDRVTTGIITGIYRFDNFLAQIRFIRDKESNWAPDRKFSIWLFLDVAQKTQDNPF